MIARHHTTVSLMSPTDESYWVQCRRFAGYPILGNTTTRVHRETSMQEDMTSCYAFTRYEQDCIYNSRYEFVLSKYFNSRCLKDVLDEVEATWLNSLFVIIKASLLKLVVPETSVCTRGGNTRYQNDFARAQYNDAALKNEMIRNCIRNLFKLVGELPSQPGLLQDFNEELDNSAIYLHHNHNDIYCKILSFYKNAFQCEAVDVQRRT